MESKKKIRKGILLLGGKGTRFLPATSIINKHLIPIIDRPMFHYSLSTLVLSGITTINIVSDEKTLSLIKNSMSTGGQLGLNLSYTIQSKAGGIPEGIILNQKFIGKSNFAVMLGDNFFYSSDLSEKLSKINNSKKNTIITYRVKNPSDFGVLILKNGKIKKIVEKPKKFLSDLVVTGLYFYQNEVLDLLKNLKKSSRGELEITDFNNLIINKKKLSYNELGRGSVWLDSGTPENHLKTSEFVRIIEERTNKKIGLLEEIAYQKKIINKKQLSNMLKKSNNSQSNIKYLKNLIKYNS
jgi:glucose-1-phosphate thymidylyltransferase